MEELFFLIPTLGRRDSELERLLKSLEQQTDKNFCVLIVSQDNYEQVENVVKSHVQQLHIRHEFCENKGISAARNYGLMIITAGIVVLSDDDCWYPEDAVATIKDEFKRNECDILLTQFYDPDKKKLSDKYGKKQKHIKNKLELMSRASIEIAFRKKRVLAQFDEELGLGSAFPCAEEIDFLLLNFDRKIVYVPKITVYHLLKNKTDKKLIMAKGYLYGKYFSLFTGMVVCLRDLIVKGEVNFVDFFRGFFQCRKHQ